MTAASSLGGAYVMAPSDAAVVCADVRETVAAAAGVALVTGRGLASAGAVGSACDASVPDGVSRTIAATTMAVLQAPASAMTTSRRLMTAAPR